MEYSVAKLTRYNEQFRLMIEAVEGYAIYWLDLAGNITSWDLGAERIKGYESQEIIGQQFSKFYTREDRANEKPTRALLTARTHVLRRHRTCLFAFVILTLQTAMSLTAQEVTWTKVTAAADWQPRDSQGETVFRDKLWIFGGWFNSFEAPPRDVWSSSNGREWTQVAASAPWLHSDLPMSISYGDRMWLMGGWYNGRLPDHSASNQVWSSCDGSDWTQVTASASWSPRLAAALVEFKGKMFLMGGTEDYYFGDANSLKNDVWASDDGKTWNLLTDNAAWSPRAYHQAAVLDDKLYLFGGGNYVPEYHAQNDVWCSEDGITWSQVTESANWTPRLWFSSAVYRNHMWVLGGWSNHPSKNWADAWYSRDGKDWKLLSAAVTWKERHEHSAFVMQDRLWIAGGHAQPLSNEVWSLQLPSNWSGDSEPRR